MLHSDRFIVWRMDWFPYRAQEWIGDDFEDESFGPVFWMAPRRGPLRLLWRRTKGSMA